MQLTSVALLVLLALVVAYDLFAVLTHRDTLSEGIWKASRRWPVIPFFFGVLAGHLFWCPCAG